MARIPLTPEDLAIYNTIPKKDLSNFFASLVFMYAGTSTDIVDLGCGHAEAYKDIQAALGNPYMTGYDSDPEALAIARANNPSDKVFFEEHLLPDSNISRTFNGVISLFFLHQLDDPTVLWDSVKQLSGTGTQVCIIDMIRAEDEATRTRIVEELFPKDTTAQYGFNAGILASYLVDELVPQLFKAGLLNLSIDTHMVGDWPVLVVHGTM